jgi:hypothetical protein
LLREDPCVHGEVHAEVRRHLADGATVRVTYREEERGPPFSQGLLLEHLEGLARALSGVGWRSHGPWFSEPGVAELVLVPTADGKGTGPRPLPRPKEIRLRPSSGEADVATKLRHCQRFLAKGRRVRVVVLLRGRERGQDERVEALLERVATDLADFGYAQGPAWRGRDRWVLCLAPRAGG